MDFNDCYEYMADFLYSQDFSSVGNDFTALMYLTGKEDGYIYFSYKNGEKKVEPVKHELVNIYVAMSIENFEKMIYGELDILRAFTTKQIQAKGNVVLAMSVYNLFSEKIKYDNNKAMRQSYSDV